MALLVCNCWKRRPRWIWFMVMMLTRLCFTPLAEISEGCYVEYVVRFAQRRWCCSFRLHMTIKAKSASMRGLPAPSRWNARFSDSLRLHRMIMGTSMLTLKFRARRFDFNGFLAAAERVTYRFIVILQLHTPSRELRRAIAMRPRCLRRRRCFRELSCLESGPCAP